MQMQLLLRRISARKMAPRLPQSNKIRREWLQPPAVEVLSIRPQERMQQSAQPLHHTLLSLRRNPKPQRQEDEPQRQMSQRVGHGVLFFEMIESGIIAYNNNANP